MHIRQILIIAVVLFGTAHLQAGKNGKSKPRSQKSEATITTSNTLRKLKKAEEKRVLSYNEESLLYCLRNSADQISPPPPSEQKRRYSFSDDE